MKVKGGWMVPYEETIPGSDVTFRMVPVPGGTFRMGSPADEEGRSDDEGPQFEVTIEPFWIGAHEVSWAEYKGFMAACDLFKAVESARLRPAVTPDTEADAVTAPSNLYDPTTTFTHGEEPELPYQRPPLSKKYLAGDLERDRLLLRLRPFYEEHRIDVRLGTRATQIDRASRTVRTVDGATFGYDALVLATGSRPRRLQLPGAELAGVHYLRDLHDTERLRAELRPGAHAIVIGGGYIGLETAATLRHLGVEVTVLEMASRTMNRVVAETVSHFYEAEHARHGVHIKLNARIAALAGDSQGHVRAVVGADGREWRADLVVVGIGVLPNDELAQAAE